MKYYPLIILLSANTTLLADQMNGADGTISVPTEFFNSINNRVKPEVVEYKLYEKQGGVLSVALANKVAKMDKMDKMVST